MTNAVIDGLRYDTETATEVVRVGSATTSISDFHYWEADLYRTQRGKYFLVGEGNARSRFAESRGTNAWSGGSGIRAVSPEEALDLASAALDADALAGHFGDLIEDA